jgi:deoxyribonuclease V
MGVADLWREPSSMEEAIRIQEHLRSQVICTRTFQRLSTIGAVDCAHAAGNPFGVAGIVVYQYPELIELSHIVVEHPVRFPYVPGLLAFRELPLILAAIESLSQLPDLLLVDGQGIAHPRRLGIASHLGVLIGWPTIGCAKSILVGSARKPADKPGSVTALKDKSETIGSLLRTHKGTTPIVVSIGHRIDLGSAVDIVRSCCDGTRLPKPLREADQLVRGKLKAHHPARSEQEASDMFRAWYGALLP